MPCFKKEKFRNIIQNCRLDKMKKELIEKKETKAVVANVGIGSIQEEKIKMEFLGDFIYQILLSIVSAQLQSSSVFSISWHFSYHIYQDSSV